MFTDYILDGRGHGEFAESLGEVRFDTGLLRPWKDDRGRKLCTVNTGRKIKKVDSKGVVQLDRNKNPIWVMEKENVLVRDLMDAGVESPAFNSAMSLRKDAWRYLDNQVITAARKRLRAWSDLAASSRVSGFDAMSKMLYEYETMSDPGQAIVDLEGLAEGRSDSPKFQLEGVPLPITYSDFWFSSRRLAISAAGGSPLNSVMAEAAGRRVAESIEKTLIGVQTGLSYGVTANYSRAASVYGYTNFPPRITKNNMTTPTGSNGPTVLSSFLSLRDQLYSANHFGPFMIYVSGDWDIYLDNLFSTTEPSAGTLRSRLLEVPEFMGIKRLDYFTEATPFSVLMVHMDSEVAQAIDGMPIRVVQWDSQGGMRKNFRVMSIQVPVLRADYNGNCGIAHGTTA